MKNLFILLYRVYFIDYYPELKLSAQSVADELGTTRVTVSRWEAGISEPDDKTKKALAEVLNTSVSYLMGETDNPEPEKTQKIFLLITRPKRQAMI